MTDVFDQNETVPNNNNVAPNVSSDPLADKLKEIVNEQGQPKYKDPLTALEALKAAQDHIKRLEDEAKAKEALVNEAIGEKTKAEALEEIVKRLTSNNPNPPKQVETPTNAGTSEEATIKLLEKVLTDREAQASAKQNASSVSNALLAKFGDKTKEVVAAKAKELGMTPQELGALSSKSPQLVLNAFGVTDAHKVAAQPTNPASIALNPNAGRTIDYVEARRQGKSAADLMAKPEKSLISGPAANDRARKQTMEEIRKHVYALHNVEN